MPLADLTETERRIIGQCLRAAADGPFFGDAEFETLLGLSRREVRDIADRFPDVDEYDDEPTGRDDSWLAINNTLANLVGYPQGQDEAWSSHISVSKEEVDRIWRKWKG